MIILSVAMGTVAAAALGLSACGGGGGGGGGGSSSSSLTSSSSSSSSIAGAGANVVTAEVDGGPSGLNAIDTLYVTVSICPPNHTSSSQCVSIPNVQVDTGSYGLRIVYDALTSAQWASLGLTQETSAGQPVAECAQWADGYSWGPVVTGDVVVGSETGTSVPVHLLQGGSNSTDTNPAPSTPYASIPADCNNGGPNGEEDTVATFGANGIIGVGPFVRDCGPGCATSPAIDATYYNCPAGNTPCCPNPDTATSKCTSEITVAQNLQVSNPVAYFMTDNNGVIIELPSIPAAGQATATGVVVFGIGTQQNNMVGNATVFPATQEYGTITTVFSDDTGGSTTLSGSYFDTGSNGNFFTDSNIPTCTVDTGFYCPSSTESLSATIEGMSGTPTQNVSFSVANTDDLTSGASASFAAFNDIAGSLPGTQSQQPGGGVFDWGLPFFFGQNVFVAIDCASNYDSGVASCATSAPFFATIAN
ncbi:MAG TPA: DUF3443 family protein [Steroidobacteraceae bacterium]|nr:DUF3443 family protein [Steroidobacteraceae bacterium]